jgi:ABC-type polysaccharide/polyol phosphate transport system ATPase subunit
MPAEEAIRVRNVWKGFRLYHQRLMTLRERVARLRLKGGNYESFWALRGVSVGVARGEMVGVIGRNGSGKTTLLRLLARLMEPDRGSVVVAGRVAALLELGAGFHPELTGIENIYLNGSLLGLSDRETRRRVASIVDFSELEEFIDTPVKHYSSGMYMRLGFAIAAHVDPEVLLVDEVLAVGDEPYQRKCLDKIAEFRQQGRTIVLVSHDLDAVRDHCERCVWLDAGLVTMDGDPHEVVGAYLQQFAGPGVEVAPEQRGSRWGSGEVEIVSVEFVGVRGPADVFRTGDAFVARIHYRAHREVANPVFGCGIFRRDGTHVTGPNTRFHGVTVGALGSSGVVEYRIERLPLLEGDYDFTAVVYDRTMTKPYDHQERMHTFRVARGGTREIYGVVTIDATWDHRPDTNGI